MAKVITIDPVAVRKVKVAFEEKVRCAYPGCVKTFVPVGTARAAYQRKGFCYCHEHEYLMAAYYASR